MIFDDLFEDDTVATEEEIERIADKMDIPVEDVNSMDASLLAKVGNGAAFVFKPLGFGQWRPTVATVTGLVAKEEVVGTFGVLYNYDDHDGEEELEENGDQIWDRVAADYTKLSAFAFMMFNLLCAPCFAAIGAIKREMNNAKWTWAAIGFMCLWAYVVSLITYQVGNLIANGIFGFGTVVAFALIILLIYLLFRKGYKPDEHTRSVTSVDAADK